MNVIYSGAAIDLPNDPKCRDQANPGGAAKDLLGDITQIAAG